MAEPKPIITTNNYVIVYVGHEHHLADVRGYAYVHRLVAEWMLCRRLKPSEEIHHINGDTTDNRPENLEVMPTRAHHKARHRAAGSTRRKPGEPNPLITCACGCEGTLFKFDRKGRPRKFIADHWWRKKQGSQRTLCACGCGTEIPARDRYNRPRMYVLGHQRRLKR